jgi:membrane protease YdiL (CAAX protease family)
MSTALRWPILGVLAAIAITSTMDATGLSVYSALPLAPLLGLCWYLQRLPRKEVGFIWGRWRHYLLAVLYPVVVATVIIFVATSAGAMDLSHTNWRKAGINFALLAVSTVLVAIITEEGFFRGWFWASLERAGLKKSSILLWSSVAFMLWHWSAVMLKTGFNPPWSQVPVFMVNAAVMGAVWGMLRWQSEIPCADNLRPSNRR